MADNSTIFNVTAKGCKDWADAINKDKFSELLTDIAEAARSGKYMLRLNNLPGNYKEKLEARGFIVTKSNPPKVSPIKPRYYIWWK